MPSRLKCDRHSGKVKKRKKAPANNRSPIRKKLGGRLFHLSADRGERVGDLSSHTVDNRDNCHRDSCSNKAIFNRRCTAVVANKTPQNGHSQHSLLHSHKGRYTQASAMMLPSV